MKKFKLKKRKRSRKEVWKKICPSCEHSHIPKEYSVCDSCLMSQFNFDIRYDRCHDPV